MWNNKNIEQTKGKTIFWFRRDLRINDNVGLNQALTDRDDVICIFIFDKNILQDLPKDDQRVTFIYDQVAKLKTRLEEIGSTLYTYHDSPKSVFQELTPNHIYCNHDYEPYAIRRDEDIAQLAAHWGGEMNTFKDQVIFEKDEVVKDDGSPYQVFTAYCRKWEEKFEALGIDLCNPLDLKKSFLQTNPAPFPKLSELGFERSKKPVPKINGDDSIIKQYHEKRDFPALGETTYLSVHLRFGTVSIRELVQRGTNLNKAWRRALIWREYFMSMLWHHPRVVTEAYHKRYDDIVWRNNEAEFAAWCAGKTGYPLVDAAMHELNTTGFMHNRTRMVAASFLIKHLLIDWRWGEAYFAEKLLDFELASNNGNWQWAAGCGYDAAPYFRVFNPERQQKRFDPDKVYLKRWLPTISDWVQPIVSHDFARKRAIDCYQKALKPN